MRATWAALEDEWAKTITRAQALPEDALHESVNDEWSFVQTLRHLVFAMDKWFTAPILGERFHPIGLPNSGSVDFPWPGLDYDLTPSVSEALAVRADRATRFRDYLASVATTDFTRPIDVLENGTNPLQECIYTVFEEEFWHNRYALRDLASWKRRRCTRGRTRCQKTRSSGVTTDPRSTSQMRSVRAATKSSSSGTRASPTRDRWSRSPIRRTVTRRRRSTESPTSIPRLTGPPTSLSCR